MLLLTGRRGGGPRLRRLNATIPMMHLRSQFTYRLVTLYSSHKGFSLREPAKQTTRTGTEGVLGTTDSERREAARRRHAAR
jgi:hypothetical protein